MSPIALFYILLASPIFSENLYHSEKLPIFDRTNTGLFERLFRTSPFEDIESTLYNPLYKTRSLWSNKVHGHRSIVSELFPVEESLFTPYTSTFESPMYLNKVVRRNVEVIRRLAEVYPEMINVVVEKLFRPEMLRHVEPESIVYAHKLFRNVPVYLREKIVRRFVKELLSTISKVHVPRRSIVSEMYPFEESSFFTTPFTSSTYEPMFFNKLNKVEKIEKLFKRMLKNKFSTVSPIVELLSTLRHEPRHFFEEELLSTPKTWSTRRLVNKLMKTPEVNSICMYCNNMCSYSPMSYSNPMCNYCTEICPTWSWESPMSSSKFFGKKSFGKHSEEKLIKKLIKKLSHEEEKYFF